MNVLFCKIPWMKYYNGITDEDKPKNGGNYIKENGGECYTFQDYNGKCYGSIMLYGDMNLESYFKEDKKNDDFLKDILVVWVATDDRNETRIVGWYKNATIYRKEQFVESFTNEEFNLYYSIYALAKDCYLLPEEQRIFPIQSTEQTKNATELIPKIIEYIENYKGNFANIVFTDEKLGKVIDDKQISNDFQELYDEGINCVEEYEKMQALKFFNTARLIKETPDLLFNIAENLKLLCCFDKAIPVYEKLIDIEGENLDNINGLMECYDYMGNREKTIEYCNILLNLLSDSKEDTESKIYYCWVMFFIYFSLRNKEKAERIIDKLSTYSDEEAKKSVEEMQTIIKAQFV
jgi:tetratricopeptide (TPR) repeat protein